MSRPAIPGRPTLRAVNVSDDEKPPIRGTGQRPKPCWHDAVVVDPAERRVTCDGCSAEVDPYEALFNLSRNVDRYEYSAKHARDSARVAEARVAELERQERNVKARIRTAAKRAPACSCSDEERPRILGYWGSMAEWRFCPACGGRIERS